MKLAYDLDVESVDNKTVNLGVECWLEEITEELKMVDKIDKNINPERVVNTLMNDDSFWNDIDLAIEEAIIRHNFNPED